MSELINNPYHQSSFPENRFKKPWMSGLTTVETTAGENFEALAKAEVDIAVLKATNEALLDRLDDLENNSQVKSSDHKSSWEQQNQIGHDQVYHWSAKIPHGGSGVRDPSHYRLFSAIPGEATSFALG